MSCSSKRVSESSCENGSSSSRKRGSTDERARQRHALLRAERQLRRQLVGGVGDADQLEVVVGDAARSRAGSRLTRRCAAASSTFSRARQPWQQARRLEHDRALGAGARHLRAVDDDAAEVARSSPAMIDSTVDLPQPEWPRMATNSPAVDLAR